MIRKILLPILAGLGLVLGIISVVKSNRPMPVAPAVANPSLSPYPQQIAGSGIIEAATENLAISSVVPGVVTEVDVKYGDDVKAGDPLFKIDDRDLQAELVVRRSALQGYRQKLARLVALPRPEDVPATEAKLAAEEASLADMQNQLALYDNLNDKRAVSEDEYSRRRYAVKVQEAKVTQAKADLTLLKAGSWKEDIAVAQSDVDAAEAQVKQTQTAIERCLVRAPVAGRILQMKTRLGEYATAGALAQPLVLLGDVSKLHVRVDVDENDAWRLDPKSHATGYLRGNNALHTELQFVRVEPYVVPKKSLTGDSTERVDTRVLQVIYSFDPATLPVYVGQQMDVFVEAKPADASRPTTSPSAG